MSKKLKQRVIDILNGAGLTFQDGYFEAHDGDILECTGRAIEAIEREYGLGESRFRNPWSLKRLTDLDGYVDLLQECLQHDKQAN